MSDRDLTFDGTLADADDETLADAIAQADLPPLLTALAAALDDPTLVPDHLRPDLSLLLDPDAGMASEQMQEARELALAAMLCLRDQPPKPAAALPVDRLETLLGYLSGGQEVGTYLELLREELALGEDLPSIHRFFGGGGSAQRVECVIAVDDVI